MKTMVKLAVLIATLLLLTGGAFAKTDPPPCNCYDVTCYDLDYPYFTITHNVLLCFGPDNQGRYDGFCGQQGTLSLFFDDPVQALGYESNLSTAVGYLKFHDTRLTVLNGIWNCDGTRYNLWGRLSESCASISDETWKKNIEPLSSSLEKVMLLQGVSYDWKADEYPTMGFTKNRQIGFIAQDVEKVFPELVQTDNNGYKGVYYGKMVPVLLEAMKEQQKEISELKKQQAMIAGLTEKIAQLEKALEQKGKKVSAE
jgi:hypothetical protein